MTSGTKATRWAACLSATVFTAVSAPAWAQAPQGIDEVVITAERHNSTVLDTPLSISALSGDQLLELGVSSVTGIMQEVPGLSMRSAGPGQTELEARGMSSSGGSAPTVGFYFNDVPMSPVANGQVGKIVIDPDLYDVDHVEVLRGPQGTLYGAGSMGGTVRIVTAQPKLDTFEGSAQTILSGTDGGGLNGGVNAMVNVPIGDQLALRVVGTDFNRSGFIDRVSLSPSVFTNEPFLNATSTLPTRPNVLGATPVAVKKDADDERVGSIRASLLAKIGDNTTATFSVFAQQMSQGGYDEFDSSPGVSALSLYQPYNLPERLSDRTQVYSAVITHDFGFATLTSETSYWDRENKQTQNASEGISLVLGYFGVIPTGTILPMPYTESDTSSQFSQELRLSSPETSKKLQWTAGLFYSDERSVWGQYLANPAFSIYTGEPTGDIATIHNPYRSREFAAFADATWEAFDRFKLSLGARWTRYISSQNADEGGAFFYPTIISRTDAAASAFTPKVTVSYEPDHDLNIYATASKGFRPGGASMGLGLGCGATTSTYAPDTVWNYEIGEKARLFDNRLTVNADVFYLDWQGVQQYLPLSCGEAVYTNAGNARSFGPEIEVKAKLTDRLTLGFNGTYTDAREKVTNADYANSLIGSLSSISQVFSSCSSAASCSLPLYNVPNMTFNASLTYAYPLSNDYVLTARLSDAYVGSVVDQSYSPIVDLPPYNMVNLRASLDAGSWTASMFVDNLLNKHAEITANNTSFQINLPALIRYSTNQPLTGGVDLTYRF